MNNKYGLAVLVMLLMIISASEASAQSRRSRSTSNFAQQLWYGGGAGLGFQSFNQQSSFLIALFPMMGYKITESISVGPRLGISYQNIRVRGQFETFRFNPVELSGAIFARAKVFRQIFGHAEYEIANEKNAFVIGGTPTLIKETANNFYIGGGYNSGGKFASEISILYNVLVDDNSLDVPFSIRAGFTYNF
ncbi:MAG: hypothetical protein HKN87_03450 [Saprospiraceae bacterium]|nr:hypothetical protein [Saprospiraceae bacterium]